MSLPTLESVQKLQTALHAKAKGEPKFRFYALYDKVFRADVLWMAWRRSRVNGGKPGVDGQTFEDIEAYGAERWLGERARPSRSGIPRESPPRRAGAATVRDGRRLDRSGRADLQRRGSVDPSGMRSASQPRADQSDRSADRTPSIGHPLDLPGAAASDTPRAHRPRFDTTLPQGDTAGETRLGLPAP